MSGRNNYDGRGERGSKQGRGRRNDSFGRQESYGKGGRSDRRGGYREDSYGRNDRRGSYGQSRGNYGKSDRYGDHGDRFERSSRRDDRYGRDERNSRGGRSERRYSDSRNDRRDFGGRGDRNERYGRNDRYSKNDRNDRYGRNDRNDRNDRYSDRKFGGFRRDDRFGGERDGRRSYGHSDRKFSPKKDFRGRSERKEFKEYSEFADEPRVEEAVLDGDFQRDHESGSEMLFGRNPVTEALKSGRDIEKILVQDTSGGSVGRILALANEKGVQVQKVTKQMLDHLAEGAAHQGIAAHVSAHEYVSVEDILSRAEERGEDPFIIVLDGIEDPHNLGAIMRSAECVGAHGIIIQKRRAVGLTQTVAKASAGAIEYMPCARVTNIARTVEELKEKNIWVYACDMDGQNYTGQNLTGPVAVVIGAEGEGISENVKKKCDGVVSLPMRGQITSLNASNAAAVLMYEVRRQRDAQQTGGKE